MRTCPRCSQHGVKEFALYMHALTRLNHPECCVCHTIVTFGTGSEILSSTSKHVISEAIFLVVSVALAIATKSELVGLALFISVSALKALLTYTDPITDAGEAS